MSQLCLLECTIFKLPLTYLRYSNNLVIILQVQKRPSDASVELEELISEPRMSKPAKPYSYNPPQRNSPPAGACTAHLSPCCQSPSLRPHPKSTPSTPCPAPSPAAAVPQSPAISPVPPQMPKGVESQDKRGKGQPPQDYPESLEPGKHKKEPHAKRPLTTLRRNELKCSQHC